MTDISQKIPPYFLILTAAFIISYLLCQFLVKFSHRWGLLDYPGDRKVHKKPTPYLGGVGVFVSFWITVFLSLCLAHFLYVRSVVPASLEGLVRAAMLILPKIVGIFIGGLVILAVGLFDDKYHWSPLRKLLGQLAAALILMKLGLTINLVSPLGFAGYGITLVWILLILNAFNFIDSLDGHCVGIAFISCASFFAITQILHQPLVGSFLAAFAGALIGFWPHNFKRAKIFLGDNGSLFIGYMMAAFTLLCKYQIPETKPATLLIPLLIFGVPIYDTVSVITVRLARGTAPWKGDRNHFAHRLVKIGMSDTVAVIFSYFIAFTIGLVAILTTQVNYFGIALIVLIYLSIVSVIAFLEFYIARGARFMDRRYRVRQTPSKLKRN